MSEQRGEIIAIGRWVVEETGRMKCPNISGSGRFWWIPEGRHWKSKKFTV